MNPVSKIYASNYPEKISNSQANGISDPSKNRFTQSDFSMWVSFDIILHSFFFTIRVKKYYVILLAVNIDPKPYFQRKVFKIRVLNLWQNKSYQMFIVMLSFCLSLFGAGSWCEYKKRHAKTKHHNKRLTLLILTGL